MTSERERINELKALIQEAQNIIIELGGHEWNADQVRYQQNRIRAMQNEMDRLGAGNDRYP